ncbi:tRNA (uracil-5-)-methyltransferase homolog B-like isoform X2 [Sminthopsis crassicaudata]|uniref:tRNA (uracil-5-)-methyltransferase homolog B-like isoform X2 n=1 Tax=Sminthopsis crassicaudata TaxID=9301 RepID=UPI003D68CBF0
MFARCSRPKGPLLAPGVRLSERRPLLGRARAPQGQPQASLASAGEGNFPPAASESTRGESGRGRDLGFWQERLADQLLPLWRLSYEEQLKVKFEVIKKTLGQFQDRLHKLGATVTEAQGLDDLLQPFIPSPVIDGYRNKSVFSVNQGPDGRPRTVGFFLRSPGGKRMFCVPADQLRALPSKHLQVAQCYEAFLRQAPPEPSLDAHQLGPWRRLRVRTSRQGHTMAILTFHAQGLSQEAICAQKERAKEFFMSGQGSVCELTSLYLKERVTPSCYELLAGEAHMFEDVLDLKLRISPGAFFPLNTGATEALLQVVAELGGVDRSTLVLDLSHGTGATGLSLARRAAQVLSVRPAGPALEDAWWSAAFHGSGFRGSPKGTAVQICSRLWPGLRISFSSMHRSPTGSAGGRGWRRPWPASGRLRRPARRCWRCWPRRTPACLPRSSAPSEAARPSRSWCSCPAGPTGKTWRRWLCSPGTCSQDLGGEPFRLSRAVPVDAAPHTLSAQLVLAFTR